MSDQEFFHLLHTTRQLNIRLEMYLNQAISGQGLTAAQAQLLLYILRSGENGVCATEIHHALRISKPSVSALVKKLKEKGYVTTQASLSDDRQKIIVATDSGKKMTQSIRKTMTGLQKRICTGLEKQELAELQYLQEKMLLNVC